MYSVSYTILKKYYSYNSVEFKYYSDESEKLNALELWRNYLGINSQGKVNGTAVIFFKSNFFLLFYWKKKASGFYSDKPAQDSGNFLYNKSHLYQMNFTIIFMELRYIFIDSQAMPVGEIDISTEKGK